MLFLVSCSSNGLITGKFQEPEKPVQSVEEIPPKGEESQTSKPTCSQQWCYQKYDLRGWSLFVSASFVEEKAEQVKAVIEHLEKTLEKVEEFLPEKPYARLQKVPIFIEEKDKFERFKSLVYHPSQKWLSENGYDPEMAESIQIANSANFLAWSVDQPAMLLHELAHAFHHQVIGYEHIEVKTAYERAMGRGLYQDVENVYGGRGPSYGSQNEREYFAEATEAYFWKNDYFPYEKSELKDYDLKVYRLLEKIWFSEVF